MGAVICWENYHPLIRSALYQQGVSLYVAPTADARPGWQATMQHIAMEGRCVVVSANQFVESPSRSEEQEEEQETSSDEPAKGMEDAYAKIKGCRGGSVIFGPLGECLAGPMWDEEGTISATFEEGEWERKIVGSRLDFDIGRGGHYSRYVSSLLLGQWVWKKMVTMWSNIDPVYRIDAFKLQVAGLDL